MLAAGSLCAWTVREDEFLWYIREETSTNREPLSSISHPLSCVSGCRFGEQNITLCFVVGVAGIGESSVIATCWVMDWQRTLKKLTWLLSFLKLQQKGLKVVAAGTGVEARMHNLIQSRECKWILLWLWWSRHVGAIIAQYDQSNWRFASPDYDTFVQNHSCECTNITFNSNQMNMYSIKVATCISSSTMCPSNI